MFCNDKEKEKESKSYTIHVKSGMAPSEVSDILEENGLIKDARKYDRYLKKNNYEIIADREEAITKAIKMAKTGDAVVILGKGEDKYIYRENGKEPWLGDHVVARKVLEEEI